MRTNNYRSILKTAIRVAGLPLFAAVVAFGQQQVNLTAGPASLTLPDGSAVPMWGYTCAGTTVIASSTATCAKLNPAAAGWSPVVITVPTGQDLQINLTNSLQFGATPIPTSLTIVGQLGGGLGTAAISVAGPDHTSAQSTVTWPIVGTGGGTPPTQGLRVQSFSTEVMPGSTATPLTWIKPRAGTYLLESGTHPSIQGPMGLYGIVVVSSAPTAYPGVTYNADVSLLFSEIDPVQNKAVSAAVNTTGFSEIAAWSGQLGGCGNPASTSGPTPYQTCYPPAVNYTPLYYLINGVAFDKTNAATSKFPSNPAAPAAGGKVLVRLVNAGLRMHVPSIIGSQTGTPAAAGLSLIAEDGNPLPGLARVQNEVFMAAGKTYDVMINVPAAGGTALPVYDRELSLSANAIGRDAGMLAYISVSGAGLPAAPALAAADTYNGVISGQTLTVSDPAKGVIANDTNVYGVAVVGTVPAGLTFNTNGTFTYTGAPTTFTYCGNGATSGPACALVTLGAATVEGAGGITVNNDAYTSNLATSLNIKAPGILLNDRDAAGFPLKVDTTTIAGTGFTSLSVNQNGAFTAVVPAAGTYTFTYKAKNSQGTVSASAATVSITFQAANGPSVKVVDGSTKAEITPRDFRWIIEEDRTFYVDPTTTTNNGSPGTTSSPTFGVNFHASYMPVVAQGCVGTLACEAGQSVLSVPSVCDPATGICSPGAQKTPVDPSQVHLDPTKRYYLSILPGDAADALAGTAALHHAHGMGGASITYVGGAWVSPGIPALNPGYVTVIAEPTPLPPSKLTVFVFEDDFPLNGEQDAGGGVDVLAVNEPGLGGFNITIFDDAGGSGDPTGQVDYDMFNQPLANSLSGTIDPTTGVDACPVSKAANGITGTVVTCPMYEADGVTLSPLAGQAVVANMMPGRYGIVATPGADRIARGEEWLQTNTLDGQKAHDSFLKVGEPAFFQEYGPASFHVTIGFANPKIINARLPGVCAGTDVFIDVGAGPCKNTLTGTVSTERMSRTPDERLYGSGSYDSFGFTQCYVSVGDPDGEDFAFTKCDAKGKFTLTGLPNGSWRITIFDQWNDMLVDGLSTPVELAGGTGGTTKDMGEIAINQWQSNIYTRTFFDTNGNGVSDDGEPGLALVPTNIRFRDGSFSNFNNTDLNGYANFNEVFPLFNWYVVETDSTRYKNTGTHVVYDAGGPADGTTACGQTGYPACGTATGYTNMARTKEDVPVPANLRVPGARYCGTADCLTGDTAGGSTGRVDPPITTPYGSTYGWQGFSGENNFLEFGKKPFVPGENGGIHGHVVYASTRPFDDPQLLLQLSWEPLVPHVTINLYQEGTDTASGAQTLKLVDTTQTSSFDDWAQGFRSDGMPNMNCPGQTTSDLFFFSLYNQPNFLNPSVALPNNAQFKCYDGMHNWNQLQPAPYDGMYVFPSVTALNPATGKPAGTNCTVCSANPTGDGTQMLPTGKYVVEVVVPSGYELVKEEDKNILIGDTFIAPTTVQFPGLGGAIYIIPDQASVGASYNANNAQNPTRSLGTTATGGIDATKQEEQAWPCVGQTRIVPDYISLFPGSGEVSPFAGATRPLCDRKEVKLDDQTSVLAKFFIFTSTHVAAHFTGVITDDFTSEFDPFSPQFGEKFAPPDLPISVKDWAGNEVNRVYADHWGAYDGLNYSTWEVNPPNPTGYSPTMMIMCMNDAGSATTPDPLFNPGYSNFCYELPFMPGQTQYMDTPVTPTSAFSEGYNHPDCNYPVGTPAISEVDGDGLGPWVAGTASHLTFTVRALGDQQVINNAYSGPSATAAPYNQKTVTRHYGFGTTQGTLTIGTYAVPAGSISTWNDTTIVFTVPLVTATGSNVPVCGLQQRGTLPSQARCGQLVIKRGDNGMSSVDAVNITVGGNPPTHVLASDTIQGKIDAATPGDLLIVDPGVHAEFLLMWKPVRLQGVGAASSVINANTHPAGKLDPWRAKVNCLFGLATNGQPRSGSNPFDPTTTYTCGGWTGFDSAHPQVDRLPLEGVLSWDTTVNGNLAQLLQEPTLMGAYEAAGITVLGKGIQLPNSVGPFSALAFGSGAESGFPAGTTLLTSSTSDCNTYPSNFLCNPSSIDGLSITNSSQGGGGIFVHAWGHNLEIANNRIYNNSGTLTGGITVGQGEAPDAYLQGDAGNADPGSCQTSPIAGRQLPYCFDINVKVHNNAVTLNSSIGDELYSSTPAGAGGITFCPGADGYKLTNNWVCGNLSTGDGGGVVHLGFSYNGDIEHNSILFNQSTNPTVPTNGGGLMVMGAPPDGLTAGGLECGGTAADADCTPGLSDGTGPGLVINANLFMGNAAESGSGGGIRLQGVNGTEVLAFPTAPARWNDVTVTNNIIANNVAGWDGGGVSLQDALIVNLINNTIVSNDSTASSGVLFNTLGAPLASSQGPPVAGQITSTGSAPQPAGVVTMKHSAVLLTNLPATLPVLCPAGHAQGALLNGTCKSVSYPLLANDVIWQNRSFYIGVGSLSPTYQQNIVSLYNAFGTTLAPSQPSTDAATANGAGAIITGGTGACTTASYWDIGVRGDTGPTNHGSGVTLAPTFSVITAITGYAGTGDTASNPTVVSQYCNGSRTPPELASAGWQVPPGISDATVPNPIFNLTPSATVDEGNNWINISWGPLSMTNPLSGAILGNYAPASTSSVINAGTSTAIVAGVTPPSTDFFGTTRDTHYDIGAVEYVAPAFAIGSVTGGPLSFGSVAVGATSASQTLTLHNTGGASLTGIIVAATAPFSRLGGTCTGTLTVAAGTCTITVVFTPTATGLVNGTVTITANVAVTGSPVALSGTGVPAGPVASVTGGPLAFGNVVTGSTSIAQTLTLHNTGTASLTGITLAFSSPRYARAAAGGTCTTTLTVATGTCTINVVFAPTATGAVPATLTITANVAVTGSPVTLSGTGIVAPTKPTLTVLDNFNRANATTLGANWSATLITVNDVTTGNTATGTAFCTGFTCLAGGAANWTGSPAFTAKQGAAFTIADTTITGDALILDATGTVALGLSTNSIRVRLNGTSVVVETTTNLGVAYTTAGTLTTTAFANGDTLTAVVDGTNAVAAPTVYVWRTTAASVTTFVGAVQITPNALWQGGGLIGMQTPNGSRVDNFAGGIVP